MPKEKTLTREEILCGMPRIKAYFREMDQTISAFEPQEGKSEGIEELKKKRRTLLALIKDLDRTDLQTLYYIHNLSKIKPYHVLKALKKLFAAQEEFKNLIQGTNNETEPFGE